MCLDYIILILADIRGAEMFEIIFQRDAKDTTLTDCRTNLISQRVRPLGRMVRPSTIPLRGAPGIPNLNQSEWLALMEAFVNR